jgi:hypothetical protein
MPDRYVERVTSGSCQAASHRDELGGAKY